MGRNFPPHSIHRRQLLQGLCGGSLALFCPPLHATRPRLSSALLFGNARYPIAPLQNPVNDAHAMQRVLTRLGFATQIEVDANYTRMFDLLRAYLRRAESSDVRLVFFAGHGVQWRGRNYLIPIDANIRHETELIARSIDLDMIVDRLAALRKGVSIIIIDACRNNPFLPRRTRGPGNDALGHDQDGLAPMYAPGGTLIAFSTAPGAVAVDSPEGENSIYTALLVERLATPGLPVERLFKEVRAEVARRTGQRQVPWENSSLMGEFCFRQGADGTCG
jgi:uncharacterized caspase-like protein